MENQFENWQRNPLLKCNTVEKSDVRRIYYYMVTRLVVVAAIARLDIAYLFFYFILIPRGSR